MDVNRKVYNVAYVRSNQHTYKSRILPLIVLLSIPTLAVIFKGHIDIKKQRKAPGQFLWQTEPALQMHHDIIEQGIVDRRSQIVFTWLRWAGPPNQKQTTVNDLRLNQLVAMLQQLEMTIRLIDLRSSNPLPQSIPSEAVQQINISNRQKRMIVRNLGIDTKCVGSILFDSNGYVSYGGTQTSIYPIVTAAILMSLTKQAGPPQFNYPLSHTQQLFPLIGSLQTKQTDEDVWLTHQLREIFADSLTHEARIRKNSSNDVFILNTATQTLVKANWTHRSIEVINLRARSQILEMECVGSQLKVLDRSLSSVGNIDQHQLTLSYNELPGFLFESRFCGYPDGLYSLSYTNSNGIVCALFDSLDVPRFAYTFKLPFSSAHRRQRIANRSFIALKDSTAWLVPEFKPWVRFISVDTIREWKNSFVDQANISPDGSTVQSYGIGFRTAPLISDVAYTPELLSIVLAKGSGKIGVALFSSEGLRLYEDHTPLLTVPISSDYDASNGKQIILFYNPIVIAHLQDDTTIK